MPIAQGVVASVNTNRRTFNTKHGPRWHLRFTLQDGRQFKYPFLNPEIPDDQLPVQVGQQVEFMYSESFHDGHQNLEVDKKTLQVTGGGQQMNNGYPNGPQGGYQNGGNHGGGYGGYQQQQGHPQQGGYQQPPQQGYGQQQPPQQQYQQPQPPKRNSQSNSGMAIGAALNQAVAMLGQGATLEQVEDLAWQLLAVADKMNDMVRQGQYKQVQQTQQGGGQQQPNPQQQTPPQGADSSQPASYNGGQAAPQGQQYQQPQGPGQGSQHQQGYDPALPGGFQGGGGGYTQNFAG